MPNLEARVSKLEKQISTLIRNMSNGKKYMENDIEAGKENTARAQRSADKNAEEIAAAKSDIVDTQDAICEYSALTDEEIADIENAMCETELSTDERMAVIEDALCELSELSN